MNFSSFSAPWASTKSNLPYPAAIAGEPTGYPLFRLSDTPLRNGDKHGNTN